MPGASWQLWLLLALAAFALPAAGEGWVRTEVGPPKCHRDCSRHGTCGGDGKCRCPFGRTGKNCEIDFLAPCRPAPGGPPNCGTVITKSCECMRRCQEYFCARTSSGSEFCQGHGFGYSLRNEERACYEREGVPPEEQYSAIPEPKEKTVRCWSGHKEGAAPLNCTEALYHRGGDGMNVPMSLCPKGCNSRGYCVRPREQTEGPGFCRCHRGFTGANCEHEQNLCYKGCSGRGKCIDQFCHCKPPYFSIGCTRSKVYPANHSMPHPTSFKIFMYDLNTQLAYDNVVFYGFTSHDPIYIAYQEFMDAFLVSPVRTENPEEAHLFFVPSFSYSYSGNVGSLNEHMQLLLDHIKMNYPYWNRTGGRDHFVWAPADRGACGLTGLGQDLIRIVHFGHHTTPDNFGPVGHVGHPEHGCFHPLKDVVAVPHDPGDRVYLQGMEKLSVEKLLQMKTRMFFFAGGVRPEDPSYSGMTRQLLRNLTVEWNDPEFDFVEGFVGTGTAYQLVLSSSKFCLAPFGHGWGNRLLQAMLSGCVPVIVQEHVVQAFEDVLPYELFSIRLNNADLPRLREILRSVTDEQYRDLLTNVLRYHKAFAWDAEQGGQAFEYTLLSLRRKHMNLKALYF
ncbi:hypothetical protein ABPG75_001855 [Micractinium tetrahymenae]